MSRCTNKVTQYIPSGYDYRPVESDCGTTGIHGELLLCDTCTSNEVIIEEHRKRKEDADADNAFLRSAGWGEM